ncbi:Uncharacterised protein [Legionella quateirensis]|uniref:Uncharacterized protein n=1 Tax=Legionella quateirensis TaxID=45072 RepID=A0A378L446_9GAMM|nr:hypothetical protein Lqua_2423 [Legionella quateirensis]STY18910.1 Uncharacterised protein [Legionella quateirensis]
MLRIRALCNFKKVVGLITTARRFSLCRLVNEAKKLKIVLSFVPKCGDFFRFHIATISCCLNTMFSAISTFEPPGRHMFSTDTNKCAIKSILCFIGSNGHIILFLILSHHRKIRELTFTHSTGSICFSDMKLSI